MENPGRTSYDEKKLAKKLRRSAGQAIVDFNMIGHGDRVMVCMSGGKDSYTMLDVLLSLQKSAPIDFELIAVNLDQKQPGFPADVLPGWLSSLGIEYDVIEQDTYGIVTDKIEEGKTMCGLCSRLRRGCLYSYASANGITRIALGHHRDDLVETLFLNLFYGGQLKAMAPRLVSDDGAHTVIRPLVYCRERDIERYAVYREYPIIPCTLCGSQPNLQRQVVKEMLRDWEKKYPGRTESIFRAIRNVKPSHLADLSLYEFAPAGEAEEFDNPDILSDPVFRAARR